MKENEKIMSYKLSYNLLQEVIQQYKLSYVLDKLFIHRGTLNRWIQKQEVPESYYNDLNKLLNNKYPVKSGARVQDQFLQQKKQQTIALIKCFLFCNN